MSCSREEIHTRNGPRIFGLAFTIKTEKERIFIKKIFSMFLLYYNI